MLTSIRTSESTLYLKYLDGEFVKTPDNVQIKQVVAIKEFGFDFLMMIVKNNEEGPLRNSKEIYFRKFEGICLKDSVVDGEIIATDDKKLIALGLLNSQSIVLYWYLISYFQVRWSRKQL